MQTLEQFIADCDANIRAGAVAKVTKLIGQIKTARVPRHLRLPLAHICLRVGHNQQGLRLLAPVVRRKGSRQDAEPREKAEYAILLQRHGAVSEALELLSSINPDEVPEALLYASFCHFNVWDYEAALPLLDRYLSYSLEPYAHLIGQVNQAAALVNSGRIDLAEAKLRAFLPKAAGHRRLEGNCHELMAQNFIFAERFDDAEREIELARSFINSDSRSVEHLFLDLHHSFLLSKKQGSLQPLEAFRVKAQAWPHPETVRECDLLSLMIQFDEKKFNHLIFGTPLRCYRERAMRVLGRQPRIDSFLFGNSADPVLDVASGVFEGRAVFPQCSLPHNVLEALARDFYRPIRLSGLFALLFPDTYFDIFSSTNRLHQELFRTRRCLEEARVPLEIVERDGSYSLGIGAGVSLRVGLNPLQSDQYQMHLDKLSGVFGDERSFTAKQLQATLAISSSASRRFLRQALEKADIEKFGASSSTTYNLSRGSQPPQSMVKIAV